MREKYKDKLIKLRDPKISKQFAHNIQKEPELLKWLYENTTNFKGVLQKDGTRKDNLGARCYAVLNDITIFQCEHGIELKWDGNKNWKRGFTKGCEKCINNSRSKNVSKTLDKITEERWKEITNARETTLLLTRGVTNPGQLPEAKAAHKAVYNDPVKVSEILTKMKTTYESRTGYTNPFHNPAVQKKKRKTSLRIYGYEHHNQNPDIAKKINANRDKNSEIEKQLITGYFKFVERFEREYNVTIDISVDDWKGVTYYENLDFKCIDCGNVNNRKITYHSSAIYCPICDVRTRNSSKGELELREYLISLSPSSVFEYGNRKMIYPKEIDIIDHSQNICFEYNGLYYHKENNQSTPKCSDYHIGKLEGIENNGYQLFTIMEDDWNYNNETVKNMIRRTYGVVGTSINDFEVMEISDDDANYFHSKNSLNISEVTGMHLGLVDTNNEIYAIMSLDMFDDDYWEIKQYSEKNGYDIVDGLITLIATASNELNLNSLIYQHDRRNGICDNFINIGFETISVSEPDFEYVNKGSTRRLPTSYITEEYLSESGYSQNDIVFDHLKTLGMDRIWDCGKSYMYLEI